MCFAPSTFGSWVQNTSQIQIYLFLLGFVYDSFFTGTRNPSRQHITPIINELQAKFKTILIAERFKESMIVLRRELCFDRKDIVYDAFSSSIARHSSPHYPLEFQFPSVRLHMNTVTCCQCCSS